MRFDEDASEMWIRNPKRFHVLDDKEYDALFLHPFMFGLKVLKTVR